MSNLFPFHEEQYCSHTNSVSHEHSLWESSDVVSLFLCIGTVLGYVFSLYWENTIVPPLFYADEVELRRTIAQLEEQAAEYDTTSTIHLRSRIQRKLLTLREEYNKLRNRRYDYTIYLTSPNEPILSRVLERATAARRGIESGNWYRRWCYTPFTSPNASPQLGLKRSARNDNTPLHDSVMCEKNEVTNSLEAQAAMYAAAHNLPENTPREVTVAENDNKKPPCHLEYTSMTRNQQGEIVNHKHHLWSKMQTQIVFWLTFANYNLPHIIKYLIRYGPLLFILIRYGDQPNIICYPSTFITRELPWMVTKVLLGLFSLAIYGPFTSGSTNNIINNNNSNSNTINSTSNTNSWVVMSNNSIFTDNNIGNEQASDSENTFIHSSSGVGGVEVNKRRMNVPCQEHSVNNVNEVDVICCSVLWWFLLCTIAICFTRRVFAEGQY